METNYRDMLWISSNLQKLIAECDELDVHRQHLENVFTILIAGSFNSGKSSLLNAVLQRDSLLPVDVLECTALLTRIQCCPPDKDDEYCLLHFVDNAKDMFESKQYNPKTPLPDRVKKHIQENEDPLPPLLVNLDPVFFKSLTMNPEKKKRVRPSNRVDLLDVPCDFPGTTPVEKPAPDQSNTTSDQTPLSSLYKYLDMFVKSSFFDCCPGLVLIDSPGLASSAFASLSTQRSLSSIDMVTVVLNNDTNLPSNVMSFISNLKKQKLYRILYVLNKSDLITDPDDLERIREDTIDQLTPYLNWRAIVYPRTREQHKEYGFPGEFDEMEEYDEYKLLVQSLSAKKTHEKVKLFRETLQYAYAREARSKLHQITTLILEDLGKKISVNEREIEMLTKLLSIEFKQLPSIKNVTQAFYGNKDLDTLTKKVKNEMNHNSSLSDKNETSTINSITSKKESTTKSVAVNPASSVQLSNKQYSYDKCSFKPIPISDQLPTLIQNFVGNIIPLVKFQSLVQQVSQDVAKRKFEKEERRKHSEFRFLVSSAIESVRRHLRTECCWKGESQVWVFLKHQIEPLKHFEPQPVLLPDLNAIMHRINKHKLHFIPGSAQWIATNGDQPITTNSCLLPFSEALKVCVPAYLEFFEEDLSNQFQNALNKFKRDLNIICQDFITYMIKIHSQEEETVEKKNLSVTLVTKRTAYLKSKWDEIERFRDDIFLNNSKLFYSAREYLLKQLQQQYDDLTDTGLRNFHFPENSRLGKARSSNVPGFEFSGCEGAVFRAKLVSLTGGILPKFPNNEYAVKLVFNYENNMKTKEIFDRFNHEKKIGLKIPFHPCISKVLHSFASTFDPKRMPDLDASILANKTLFFVSNFDGQNMLEVFNTKTKFPDTLIAYYLLQLVEALRIIFDSKIVHRDLKPDNIFIQGKDWDAILKIGDFGMAWDSYENPNDPFDDMKFPYFSSSISKGGCPAYLAPEVISAVPRKDTVIDYSKNDIYALGLIATEIINNCSENLTNDVTKQQIRTSLLRVINQMKEQEFSKRISISEASKNLSEIIWGSMFQSLLTNKLNGLVFGNSVTSVKQYLIYNFICTQLSRQAFEENIPIFEQEVAVPDYWSPGWENVELNPDSLEFRQFETMLKTTIVPHGTLEMCLEELNIVKITRVQNETLWKKYSKCRDRFLLKFANTPPPLQKPRTGLPVMADVNEFYFMHGSSPRNIKEKIIKDGFSTQTASSLGCFGCGLYFAENSSKANLYASCPTCEGDNVLSKKKCVCPNREDKVFCMLVCRVILGDPYTCTQYNEEIFRGTAEAPVTTAPMKSGTSEYYDSIVVKGKIGGGDLVVYNEFVVYDSCQVYPEYLVEYKRKQGVRQVDEKVVEGSIYEVLLSFGGKG